LFIGLGILLIIWGVLIYFDPKYHGYIFDDYYADLSKYKNFLSILMVGVGGYFIWMEIKK